ncbi:hypothetical protein DPMN_189368 [Dreissena polymorpha]|uniref:Apple domain-containing protein n=1 Tax=Dreissena polymorpha TaxID=45954 RepID=A0A9D4DVE1_DREPO|nr:hypothetical protein DPMN_189368 [Dreissena polymorpha]
MLLVAAEIASIQLKTNVFEMVQLPICFLNHTETVFAKDKHQCIIMCKSGCQFSMFNHSTGACNLYTDGDTSQCDETTDDHQYFYMKVTLGADEVKA